MTLGNVLLLGVVLLLGGVLFVGWVGSLLVLSGGLDD